MAQQIRRFGIGQTAKVVAVAGFVFTAIGCAIYNFVAGYVGGIEVELESERATT